MIGILASSFNLIWIGIILEMVILLFQVVTLPVEFDASKRALSELEKYNYLNNEELRCGKVMLTSAALTYVASVASTLLQILRLILIFGRRDD
jgi:Zn-dependent membrane protease YugP